MSQVIFTPNVGRRMTRRVFVWLGLLLALLGGKEALALPTITVQPLAVNLSSSLPAVFSVTAIHVSLTPISIQWRRNGQNIPGALTISLPVLTATSLLSLTNVQSSDMGAYSAVVYDADGTVNTAVVNLTLTNLPLVLVGNLFANRNFLPATAGGSVRATNFSGTIEPGEPKNDDTTGGASVWLAWVAPTNGIARFDTRGSDFDTTMGIYQIDPRNPTVSSVTNLLTVVGDDDSGNYFNSTAVFNAVAGVEYEIQVDGFYADKGHFVLNWSLDSSTTGQVPILTEQPRSLTVNSNASATFQVDDFQGAHYLWFFNGVALPNETRQKITIPAVTAANVGQYSVQVYYSNLSQAISSQPAHLQINLQGNTSSAAQSKFRQAADPTLTPRVVIHPNAVPVSGFSGTHIWNTYGAASEPGEPNHCDKPGGAPYWFAYQAPANGNLTVDAYTPTFTNVLAVYTWPGGDFSALNPVACASTNFGLGHETAVFPTVNGTTYYLVVDGLNGAVGNVTLSYSLVQPAAIIVQPKSQTVAQGSNVTLTVTATGGARVSFAR